MLDRMSKRERLQAHIENRVADRPGVALWRHWPVDDQNAETLARATIAFQQRYDFDFVKVTPSSSFCLRDWGSEDFWRGHYHGTREYGRRVINDIEDWYLLKPLEPREGALGVQLEALRLIREGLGPDVPVIQTIFCPLSQAKNLAGPTELLAQIRQHPEAVAAGLRTIANSTAAFVEAAMKQGIDGIFYAVQFVQAHLLNKEEYQHFGRPHDLRLLELAGSGWLNVLHLHGTNVAFDQVADYPVHVINWHDRETPPSLGDALDQFGGAVCGGIRQEETLVLGSPADVKAEVEDAVRQTSGRRLIVGTGCVTPTTAPTGNLWAARKAVESA